MIFTIVGPNGAYDYVTKPFSVDELKLLLERVASHLKLKAENRMLREKVKSKQGFGGIVGRAPEMEKLYRIIAKAANRVHPVLILGESGTGKELVAQISVDCILAVRLPRLHRRAFFLRPA